MKRILLITLLVCSFVELGASEENIRINEFCIKGGEWIELYNPNPFDVSLNGYSIETKEDLFEFTGGTIPADGFYIFEPSGFLDNDGDIITLRDNTNSTIDMVSYGYEGYAPAPPSHKSCAFINEEWNLDLTPTKGEENDVANVSLGSSLMINEIYEKTIEFYNPQEIPINIKDFFITDGDKIDTIDLNSTIYPHDVLVFESTITFTEKDVLYLFDNLGRLIDMIGYYSHDLDESLQRIPDGDPTFGYSWETSNLYDIPESLGSLNDFFIISEVYKNFIELYTPIPREVSFSITLETKREFTLYVDRFLIISNNDRSFFREFRFHSDIVINESFNEITIEFKGMEDHLIYDHETLARIPIKPNSDFKETKPTPKEYNKLYSLDPPLVITEVMYNPKKPQLDKYYEWIEIYNRSDLPYDPENLYFENKKINGDLIPPGEYAVIADSDTHLFDEIDIKNKLKLDGNLSLSNSGDYIAIMEGDIILDDMTYHKNSSKEGFSLEKINGVWRKGRFGGTPGYAIEIEEREYYDTILCIFRNNDELEKEIAEKIAEMESTSLSNSEEFLSIKNEFESFKGGFIIKNRFLKDLKRRLDSLKIYEKNILFLENKDQYYKMNESLKKTLNEQDIGLYASTDFPDLERYDIVFVTNPENDFEDEEIQKLEKYMKDGGILILCGTYYTYLNTDLNRISEKYGTTFVKSSLRDDESNSGKNYYVIVKEFPDLPFYENIEELNISGGALLYEDCTVILKGNETTYAVTENNTIENFAIITLKKVGDGYLICSGSSQMFTTGIKYGDNLKFTVELIEYLLSL
ncbi:hypothetical protein DRN50_00655 [Thermococci archaeon]|nr:MAG: hypothetical protein DRN50_00655 [Thermococci archaeon]